MKRWALALLVLAAACGHAHAQDAEDGTEPPAAYEAASVVHVHFESEAPGVVLWRADAATGWASLGVGPIDLTLERAPIELALTSENRAPVRIPFTLDLREGARLVGHYDSRQTLRELGVGLVLGTLALVLIGIAVGATGFLAHDVRVGVGGLVAAAAVGVVGEAAGIALATLEDIATIDLL